MPIIAGAGGRLWCEALVIVVVTVEHHVGAGIIERLPERPYEGVIAMWPGAETRVMKIGQRTLRRMCCQVRN
jgi:hypothetical protein